MAPVSNPDIAGSSSGSSSSKVLPPAPAWPESVQMRLKELEAELEEEEITKKGFWKQKYQLVETFLNKFQMKEVTTAQADSKAGKISDKVYFEKLKELLVPAEEIVDEGVKDEEEAMKVDEENEDKSENEEKPKKETKEVKRDEEESTVEGPSGDSEEAGSSSSSSAPKREKNQPSIMAMFKKATVKKDEEKKRKSSRIEDNAEKKPKLEGTAEAKADADTKVIVAAEKVSTTRCGTCRQLLDSQDTIRYESHPSGAVEEFIGMSDPKLSLFEEGDFGMEDSMPQYKLTGFTVYDKAGHVVPFDTGLIDKNKEIFFSGYLKHLTCEEPGVEDGVPVYDCGPINSWWNAGFDGGEKALTGFSTGYAEYYLMECSETYMPFMKVVNEKAFVAKQVIEYLEKAIDPNNHIDAEYEDLLNHLGLIVPPEGMDPIGDETLIRHADFVVHQVYSYEDAADDDEPQLVGLPAMRSLIKLAGVKLTERRKLVIKKNKPMPKFTSATVTPLVRGVFDAVFSEQMAQEKAENEGKVSKARSKRCGMCDQCMRGDCGVCNHCKDMTKFGGSGKSKQACKERKCTNMAVKEEDESGSEAEEPVAEKSPVKTPVKHKAKGKHKDVEFTGEGVKKGRKTYYEKAILDGDLSLTLGDTVLIQPTDPSTPLYVAILVNMSDGPDGYTAHVQWYGRGTDTMLGEAADPTELFLLTDCEDQPLLSVWKKCNVEMKAEPDQEEWRSCGGGEVPQEQDDDGLNFWCKLWYDPENARYEYPVALAPCPEGEESSAYCGMCTRKTEESKRWKPVLGEKTDDGDYSSLTWDRAPMKPGDSVYLEPGTAKLRIKAKSRDQVTGTGKDDVDENMYPEYYRKRDYVKGNNNETPDPFQVCTVKKILKEQGEVKLCVQMYYRPENTHKGAKAAETAYYNQLYWSEEETVVPFSSVTGRCWVKYADLAVTDQVLELWTEEGPDRWFFREMYNSEEKSFEEPPPSAQRIGQKGKGGKGKGGKGKSSAPKTEESDSKDPDSSPSFPPVPSKLRCLDIFSGCGGLSHGLHEAGVAHSEWAIEIFEPAAQAYKLNNPECTVFSDDCNLLLRQAMEGTKTNHRGQRLPLRGEVDLLCGGPPCQGFSGMNRFNHREYSQFKNSLVSTYLSYCEYYRPRFFILENVRNFASYKKSMVLKLCIRTLVKMGYQCSFGILQAGQYGVAQTRRRAILLAAAPGETLPLYPEPRHVFSPQACHLAVEIEGTRFTTNARWVLAGPYRTTTVRDTMSDLPRIKNGASKLEISYGGEAKSNFQKRIRRGSEVLKDHVTKNMAPLIEARFELIPTAPGSDWRDLPNKVMTLKDGTQCRKLVYCYNDVKHGKSSTGAKRGVCSCADGKNKCDPADKQQNTLIPWCLPHTSNRHNNWAGLYGRVEWDGFFSTTITNPEPMGKQGRVLHPDQNRLVSVRECARSQGFPDTYKFYGTALEKHRQVGNAVPPPMGKAVGLQIRQAMGVKRS